MKDFIDDFNSSDIEFETVVKKGKRKRGERSIQAIIEHAEEDRISSKRTVKTLEFGKGAPGTIAISHLWVQRFTAFREYTLRQSIEKPFSGDDLLRFFDSIISKLKPNIRGKVAPSSEYICVGHMHLSEYGTFTYTKEQGYKLTERDTLRYNTWMDDAIKAGRLTKGLWKKKVWLNYTIVSRMAKAWLNHFEKRGTRNWDLVIARLLSIVMVTSVGMRVGDVTRSTSYVGEEYVKYKDIEMKVEGDGTAKLKNLRARVTLSFLKDRKDIKNDDVEIYFRTLEDPKENQMCIVSLILIHALRHGMVRGSTIDEVLNNAIRTPDSHIAWLYPHRPLLTAIKAKTMKTVNLDQPANPSQMLRTVKEMGLISNLLSPVTLHALRYGAAQDVAHLPRNHAAGFVDDTVRQSLGHSNDAMHRGVTEMYAGSHTRETYNDRAAAKFSHVWGAKFGEGSALEFVKRHVPYHEIKEWQRLNEPDANHQSRASQYRAREAIRKVRHEEFIATAAPERRVLSDKQGNVHNAPPSPQSKSSGESIPPIRAGSKQASVPQPGQGQSKNGDPDTHLLEEDDLDNVEVDLAALDLLQSQVVLDITDQENHVGNDDIDDGNPTAYEALLADAGSSELQEPVSNYDFITYFSKINLVNCTRFADQWPHYQKGALYADSIGCYSVCGNSRSPPTPMIFKCQATSKCPYTSIRKRQVTAHEATCSPLYVSRELYREDNGESFHCTLCKRSFLTQHSLNMHIKSVHEFTKIPCPRGCDPAKIYPSQRTLDAHLRREHSGIWPARCLYPGCEDDTMFKSSSYSNHLTKAHNLTRREDRAPYFPATMKNTWTPTACPIDDCTSIHEFAYKASLTKHLVDAHGYERKAANDLTAKYWITGLSIEVQEQSITRKPRRRAWEVDRANDENEDDEYEDDGIIVIEDSEDEDEDDEIVIEDSEVEDEDEDEDDDEVVPLTRRRRR